MNGLLCTAHLPYRPVPLPVLLQRRAELGWRVVGLCPVGWPCAAGGPSVCVLGPRSLLALNPLGEGPRVCWGRPRSSHRMHCLQTHSALPVGGSAPGCLYKKTPQSVCGRFQFLSAHLPLSFSEKQAPWCWPLSLHGICSSRSCLLLPQSCGATGMGASFSLTPQGASGTLCFHPFIFSSFLSLALHPRMTWLSVFVIPPGKKGQIS